MSVVYLVRHGQASFDQEDYDQLSEQGLEQCRQLARHWVALERPLPLLFSGRLRRQQQSAESFAEMLAQLSGRRPEVSLVEGLEEYDFTELMRCHAQAQGWPFDLEILRQDRRQARQLLQSAVQAWALGELVEAVGSYAQYRERCVAALRSVLSGIGRKQVAVVFGSAGSLGAAVQPLLGIGDWEMLRLTLTFHNTGSIKLLTNGISTVVESINTVAHLEQPGVPAELAQR